LERDLVTETWVVAGSQEGAVGTPAFSQRVNGVLDELSALGPQMVSYVPSVYPMSGVVAEDPELAPFGPIPSEDGRAVLFTVVMTGDADTAAEHVGEVAAVREAASGDGIQVFTLGEATSTEDFRRISEEDLRFGESIGILAAIVVLVIVFGSLVAGVTPIVMGVFSIAVTLGIIALIGQIWRITFFAPNLVSMMGLAVGIDYSLFIVSRYREERQRGRDKLEAIDHAGETANRAVFFSGVTVILALAGMLLIPVTIFRGLAGGAIVVVAVSVAASMTLLPAVLSLLGDRVNAGRIFGRRRQIEHGRPGGFWDRMSRGVMARPVLSLVLAAGFLIALSLPFWLQAHPEDDGVGIKQGMSGISTMPDDVQTKEAFTALVQHFPKAGANTPAQIVILGSPTDPAVASGIEALDREIADDPNLGAPTAPRVSEDGSLTLVDVPLAAAAVDTQSEAAVQAVRDLRERYVPAAFGDAGVQVFVGGESAFLTDFLDVSGSYTPVIILIVLGLSFVLLTIVFRSIVVPAKAIVMNLLSVGAAYGAIVLVFQRGGLDLGKWVADVSGFQQVDAIDAWLPLFLFSILFGLSMDYHVFLLSRIREEYDRTQDNAEAVAYGLRTTGGIITGAAIIMVAVFSGFAAGRLVALEEMGFGLAIAVFIDATVVRSILVPSTMRLLGDRNWYLPRWLRWLPQVRVEGPETFEEPVLVPELEPVGADDVRLEGEGKIA
ncbi:MAG TPA: MMPL family transporter, partial [Actinomycetota bacterium]|nr:MMPL family transporter [Actinomycetota bacterium]